MSSRVARFYKGKQVDDLQFLEWRAPEQLPYGFLGVVAVRAATQGTTVSATFPPL